MPLTLKNFYKTASTRPDITTAVSDNISITVSSQHSSYHELQGLGFSVDGTYIYYCDLYTGAQNLYSYIWRYTLSTPRDLSTAGNPIYFQEEIVRGQPSDVYISPDGTKMFIAAGSTGKIKRYTMITPYDITTASLDETLTTGGNLTGISINDNGTKMYIADYTQSKIYKYPLATPYSTEQAIYSGYKSYPVSGSVYRDIIVSTLGEKIFLARQDGNIYQMDMSTNFDITTATYNSKYKSLFNGICGLYVNPQGTKLYVTDISSYKIYQYSLGGGGAKGGSQETPKEEEKQDEIKIDLGDGNSSNSGTGDVLKL